MFLTSRCHLSAKDFSILQKILRSEQDCQETYLRLLRRKLAAATVLSQDEAIAQIATINSHIEFSIDGHRESCTLVYGDNGVTGQSLPITTLRGLHLLGLAVGDSAVVEYPDGRREKIRLDRVSPPMETNLEPANTAQKDAASNQFSTVISFMARRSLARVQDDSFDPDDDPGPRAA